MRHAINGRVGNVAIWRGMFGKSLPRDLPCSKASSRALQGKCARHGRGVTDGRRDACDVAAGVRRSVSRIRLHETVSAQSVPRTAKVIEFQTGQASLGSCRSTTELRPHFKD